MVKTKSEEWDFQPLSELVMGGRVTGTSPADTGTIPFLGVNKPADSEVFCPWDAASRCKNSTFGFTESTQRHRVSSIRNVCMVVLTNQQVAGWHYKITRSYPGIGEMVQNLS